MRRRSNPFPPAPKSYGFLEVYRSVSCVWNNHQKMPLVILGDTDSEIHHLHLGPLAHLFQNNPDHPFIRGVLNGIF